MTERWFGNWIRDCPRCGNDSIFPETREEPFGLCCDRCGWTGPREGLDECPDAALVSWNNECDQIAEALRLGLAVAWFSQPDIRSSTVDARGRAAGVQSHTEELKQYQLVMAPAVGIEPTTN